MKTIEELKEQKRYSVELIPGVYFLFNENELVYIGESEDIHRRVGQHRTDKEYDSYTFIEQRDPHLRLRLEKAYIEKFRPEYNKQSGNISNKSITTKYESNEKLIRGMYKVMKKNGYKKSFVWFQYLEKSSYYCIADLKLIAKKLGYKKKWVEYKIKELENHKKWWNYNSRRKVWGRKSDRMRGHNKTKLKN